MNNEPRQFPGAGIKNVQVPNQIITPGEEVPTFSVRDTGNTTVDTEGGRYTKKAITTSEPVIMEKQEPVEKKAESKPEVTQVQQNEVDYTETPVVQEKRIGSDVSDTVASLLEGFEAEDEAKENVGVVEDLLSKITVDLNSIDIENGSLDNIEAVMNMMESKPVKQVVNCQSAYASFMTALNNSELRSLDDSDVDMITYRKRLAKILHKHMQDTSIGTFDFPTFERITSYFDLETLIYGVYCQTYPYDNKYTIPKCPGKDCGEEYQTIVNNNTLIETRSENDVFARIDQILASVKNPTDVVKASLLSKTKRISLPEKKIIFDIRIPSIYNYLEETLVHVDKNTADQNPAAVGTSIFVQTMYVPDLVKLKNEGKLSYIPVNDRKMIINTLINLSLKDSGVLTKAIDDIGEKYKVTYSLKNVTCPHCGHVIPNIELNMEQMLFLTFRLEMMGEN